eukprot:351975-Chlamydomonas_euryale.AAC.1
MRVSVHAGEVPALLQLSPGPCSRDAGPHGLPCKTCGVAISCICLRVALSPRQRVSAVDAAPVRVRVRVAGSGPTKGICGTPSYSYPACNRPLQDGPKAVWPEGLHRNAMKGCQPAGGASLSSIWIQQPHTDRQPDPDIPSPQWAVPLPFEIDRPRLSISPYSA